MPVSSFGVFLGVGWLVLTVVFATKSKHPVLWVIGAVVGLVVITFLYDVVTVGPWPLF